MIKKSLFYLLIMGLFLSGCSHSDYIEPEKRTVVTAIIVDYEENSYNLSLETISHKKQSEEEAYSPYYIKGSGEDIISALTVAQDEVSSEISIYHCPLIICSERVYKEKQKEIFDFILNTPQISLGADMLLCKNIDDLFLENENFLGYEISDTVNLKNKKTNILGIINGKEKPFYLYKNEDEKIIITENLDE